MSSDVLRRLYPEVEPYESGHFDVGDGHSLYYERCGTPGAKPAVFLHGGPGAGIAPAHRRLFDPARYDVLLFDQRGCGRSVPHASIENNSTWHLVTDIERLRAHLGIEQWLVFGGSWGSTLAIAYAERYPEHVSALVLRGIFLGDRASIDWFYRFGASEIFPEEWAKFRRAVDTPGEEDLIAAYYRRLSGPVDSVPLEVARAWSRWEAATVSLLPDTERERQSAEARNAIAVARIETHFFANDCWFEPEQLLREASRLAGIPGVIVHGRYDICCAPGNAWKLHQSWPQSTLRIVEGAGHVFSEPGITNELVRATDMFAA
ncbi:proline iminopeptidase [Sphingopyxis sp. Root1497]|uniref:prolyl aminopeptidase n=1 Tax=Sphingopyxis sp. Root1497 TaxID=1736474 RepID=UPI0006F1F515|nr:prolyl aminopeptidase [Sphingopyxis sp. Root1497]KQZ60997.1 proline iminopeptidase [Sphingopyxis sp. Root1497]